MRSDRVIGAKTKYGVTNVFVYEKLDGSFVPCLLENGIKVGFPEQTYPNLERAKEAAATDAINALNGSPLSVGEDRSMEAFRRWDLVYDSELPEACRHPRNQRSD